MKVLINFYKYVFQSKSLFFAYLLLAGLSQIVGNLQPFFLKWITSSVLVSDYQTALSLAFGFGGTLFLNTFLYTIAMLFEDRSGLRSAMNLQMDVMRKIHDLDFAYHTKKSSGRLISLMKRGEDSFLNVFDILNKDLYFLIISLVFMLGAFGSMGVKYVTLSIVALLISGVFSLFLIKINIKTRRRFIDLEDAVSGVRVDNLINFDSVKYFAKEQYEQNRLKKLLQEWYEAGLDYFKTFRYFDISIGNFSNIAIIGTIILSLFDLQIGKMDLSGFVLISSFSVIFFPKLMNIAMSLRTVAKRFSDLELYFDVLEEKTDVPDPEQPVFIAKPAGRVNFYRMGFSYHKTNPVFADFSLNIAPGEAVALVGLSGSGKTTLIKLLMRMYDINSGSIDIDGVDIKNMQKSYLRSLIGIVPQDPLMFNHTIGYNVGYANLDASESEVWSALAAAHMDDFTKSLPDGLETKVGERGIKLSGGQRQRLAIARVILEKPKIIVFDEATSSLDSESEKAVQEALWQLIKDPGNPRTSIIIAHRLSTVMRADRIVVLHEGTIAETGTHRSLLKRKDGLYKHLWDLQQNGFLVDL